MPDRTLLDLFDACIRRPRADLLAHRGPLRWRRTATSEFASAVRALACALPGLRVGPGDRVLLLSENRPEWQIADFAIQHAGAVTVPVYPTLPAGQIRPLLADSGAKAALVSTGEQLRKLREAAGDAALPAVLFDAEAAGELGGIPLDQVLASGALEDRARPDVFAQRKATVTARSLATIIYTSGTTGTPKGVMLTHGNLVSNVDGCLTLVPFGPADVVLSFLPLSHVFQRTVEYTSLSVSAGVAYAESVDTAARDAAEIRPTIFPAVPRFFEKVYARLMEGVAASPAWRQALFRWAVRQATARLRRQLAGEPVPVAARLGGAVAQRLVGRKLQHRVGGRVRFFISGGAPLSRELAEFFPAVGVLVLEGYGLTETSPVIAVNPPWGFRPGTVGPVLPGVEVRIAGDGEVLVRGPNVMQGYWNQPAETAEVLHDGWLNTGDVGQLDGDGYLTITDRKKDLIITSAGKNIAPQPIENALRGSAFIANAVCVGDRRNYLAALVVPDFDALAAWAREQGIAEPLRSTLLARPDVQALYRREIDAATALLARFERVKRFALLERDFSLEAGELTPTFKVRRRVVNETYAPLIESLYEEGAAESSAWATP